MKYSIRHIAEIVHGELAQFHGDAVVEHLLLDSRRLIFPATSMFIALRGPRRDGSRFIEELYRRGVKNFMVDPANAPGPMPDANIIFVQDTLAALQADADTLAAAGRAEQAAA